MEQKFNARFYDGHNSTPHAVEVDIDSQGQVQVHGHPDYACAFADMTVSARVGNTSRYLHFPEGGTLETDANDIVDALCEVYGSTGEGILHSLENHRTFILCALLVLFVGGYSFVRYGIPALSREITDWIPRKADSYIAGEALQQMDAAVFKPSKLPEEQQDGLQTRFLRLSQDIDLELTLLFRDGGELGANAFALPDGHIIFTDQMIALADDPVLLEGVMLHEIGHVYHRHGMRGLVQQAGLATVVGLLIGDITAASGLILAAPGILIQAHYSRELESEADGYALAQMRAQGIDPSGFAEIMEKLEKSHRGDSDDDNPLAYFSSHPPSNERAERFRGSTP